MIVLYWVRYIFIGAVPGNARGGVAPGAGGKTTWEFGLTAWSGGVGKPLPPPQWVGPDLT
jgi:hypothetical protein